MANQLEASIQGWTAAFGLPLLAPTNGGTQHLRCDERGHHQIINAHLSFVYIDKKAKSITLFMKLAKILAQGHLPGSTYNTQELWVTPLLPLQSSSLPSMQVFQSPLQLSTDYIYHHACNPGIANTIHLYPPKLIVNITIHINELWDNGWSPKILPRCWTQTMIFVLTGVVILKYRWWTAKCNACHGDLFLHPANGTNIYNCDITNDWQICWAVRERNLWLSQGLDCWFSRV